MAKRNLVHVGEVFSRLTVLSLVPGSRTIKPRAICRCSCGNECTIIRECLRRGTTKSCGCLHRETSRTNITTYCTKHPFAIGSTFGRLTVTYIHLHTKENKASADCSCECGNSVTVLRSSLVTGNTTSCGCLKSELTSTRHTKHGQAKAGPKRSPEYSVWATMLQRCTNPKSRDWADYGGRGITICNRWLTPAKGGCGGYVQFIEDMGPRPSSKHSIDRTNNSLGYGPDNCKWVTSLEQACNRRPRKTKL